MYHEFPPNENLSRLISTYVCLDINDATGNFFAPDITHTSIIVTVKSNVEIQREKASIIPQPVSIMGAFDSPFYFSYQNGEITAFIADFQPIGMYELTGRAGSFFANKFVDASEIWGADEVNELHKALSGSSPVEERIQFLDAFLESKAPDVLSEKSLLVEKADQIAKTKNYQCTVKELCSELGVSVSSLGRSFQEVLGISPKQYFARALFEKLLNQYTVNKQNTVDVLPDSSFYDYSHVNKWFKKFANTSPSDIDKHNLHFIEKVLSRIDKKE